jgi:hypothetical protein
MIMKNIIKIALALVIIALAYFIYESIMEPVRFNKDKDDRYAVIIQQLKDIRDLEKLFKNANKRFTANYDSLFMFAQTGKIPMIKMVPDPTDTTFTRSITDTIGFTLVKDSLFGKRPNFDINSLKMNPFASGKEIKLEAGFISKSSVKVPVFMASVENKDILIGLDEQLVINLDAYLENLNRFKGLKVGSMSEVSIDGNWE